MAKLARANLPTLKKTASYYVLHIVVAATVAYAITDNFWLALTLSLIEPSVQAVAFFFHEKAWQRWGSPQLTPSAPSPSAGPGAVSAQAAAA